MLRRQLLLASTAFALPAMNHADEKQPSGPRVVSRAHGWASSEGGTATVNSDPIDIRSRSDLLAAFALGSAPKRLVIHGMVDLSEGRGPEGFRDPAYNLEKYCEAYQPSTWGKKPLVGPLEEARKRSAANQARVMLMKVPSNTTIIGAKAGSGFANGSLLLDGVQQVIMRGLLFTGVLDHFPEWDPNDGEFGEWNSDYDCVTLRRSHHVWFDHCHFLSPKVDQKIILDRPFEQTDGLLDITRRSDCVTVSWCRFSNHKKTMLIGGSDKHVEDRGSLRITLDHNHWENCVERAPRVRFGQIQLVNNLFSVPDSKHYLYSIGLGFESQVLSVSNAWEVSAGIDSHRLLRVYRGTQFTDIGSIVNGKPVEWAKFEATTFSPPSVPDIVTADKVADLVRANAGPAGLYASLT